jgi:hypothetical protein
MTNDKEDIYSLAARINAGIQMAVNKLIEREAALGGTLVVGDKDGFKTVPAKELLREREEQTH